LKAAEFKRKVWKLGKSRGIALAWDKAHGKGSHGTLSFGDKSTTLKDLKKELGIGLLKAMCDDLGITVEELRDV
jgi:mRNA interferase HicA